ncbi:MAG TPA: FeoA family protein [Haloplasmataceae bacterium]
MENKTVFSMEVGETGTITELDIDKKLFNRYLDLGIAPNALVKLINKVNFNQLYIIEVDDVEICIRRKDAKKIRIRSMK